MKGRAGLSAVSRNHDANVDVFVGKGWGLGSRRHLKAVMKCSQFRCARRGGVCGGGVRRWSGHKADALESDAGGFGKSGRNGGGGGWGSGVVDGRSGTWDGTIGRAALGRASTGIISTMGGASTSAMMGALLALGGGGALLGALVLTAGLTSIIVVIIGRSPVVLSRRHLKFCHRSRNRRSQKKNLCRYGEVEHKNQEGGEGRVVL